MNKATHSAPGFMEGRVIVRHSKKMVLVLCPRGHVLTGTTDMKSFAGSMLEAMCADPDWRARCDGTVCETFTR